MDPSFWLQRWDEGRIGFHQSRITPMLLAHWESVGATAGECVFVPLAGKSLDMAWFASQGLSVLGSELSPLAVEQFFEGAASSRVGNEVSAGAVTLIEGDVFGIPASRLASCSLVYDRAALIALPPEMRTRYVAEVYGRLPLGCRGMLVTLEYPLAEKSGPPFAVLEDEVRALFSPAWSVSLLERRDILAIEPGFVAEGVTALATCSYLLERR